MAKKSIRRITSVKEIEQAIHVIRGQRVMLDSDLAVLYGVTTRQLNQQVSRNSDRFPEDFAYQLMPQEFSNLMSQSVTSRSGHGGRRKRPWAFTEQGVAMLSSVLKSPTAVRVNIEIMRAFVRMRQLMATPGELVEQLTKLKETVQLYDGQIRAIAQVMQQMMESRWLHNAASDFMRQKTNSDGYSPRNRFRISSNLAAISFSKPRSVGR